MIRITYQVLGGHTHITFRSGRDDAPHGAPMALAGTIILDNEDGELLIDELCAAVSPRVQVAKPS